MKKSEKKRIVEDQLTNPHQSKADLEEKTISRKKSYGNVKIASSWVSAVNSKGKALEITTKSGKKYTTPAKDLPAGLTPNETAALISASPSVGRQVNSIWGKVSRGKKRK